jgi:CrcB protein
VGCFAIGYAAGGALSPRATDVRLFLTTGVLGGFTTFSAFGLEAHNLARAGRAAAAALYVLGHIVLGLLAVAAGGAVARLHKA